MLDNFYQALYLNRITKITKRMPPMLLTKECDYSLRIMRVLSDENIKTVKAICDLEHIPHMYAYKILKKLQNAGLVQNKLGPGGGYHLIRPLNSFTLYDVISAVDDNLFLFECLRDDKQCPNNGKDTQCNVHKELVRLQNSLVSEMKSKTMEAVLSQI